MTPKEQARVVIDEKLEKSGWTIQDMRQLNLAASLGVAVREFPTSTGPVDYALFSDGLNYVEDCDDVDAYKKVFKMIFEALGQYQHYNMMTNKAKS